MADLIGIVLGFTFVPPNLHFILGQFDYQTQAFLITPILDHKSPLQHNDENWNIANLSAQLLIHDARDYNEYIQDG
ncbi:hypothetical protein [Moorena sp. SIO4G3]|uniref:hypothetical protein n=1 Tax=Moorena sp. SIO4G3 TaxID=2607821 RepID=UPI0025E79448|nr:hypothetical protein [Moorena sp. SIO4G3]